MLFADSAKKLTKKAILWHLRLTPDTIAMLKNEAKDDFGRDFVARLDKARKAFLETRKFPQRPAKSPSLLSEMESLRKDLGKIDENLFKKLDNTCAELKKGLEDSVEMLLTQKQQIKQNKLEI